MAESEIREKSIKEISSSLRNSFQKVQDAERKNNVEYAISLAKNIVKKEPGFLECRAKLREMELNKPKPGPLAVIGNFFKIGAMLTKAQIMKSREQMNVAEDALALDIRSVAAHRLLAKAARSLDANFIAIDALETASELNPKNLGLLNQLAELYEELKQGTNALRIRQKIVQLRPNNMDAQAAVRTAAAMATMEEQWESNKEKSFKERIKSKDEAKALEQQDRIVRNIDDINDMITNLKKEVAEEGESLTPIRKLAELYQKAGEHDKAIEFYNKTAELMGTLDPTIDRGIEKSEVAKLDNSVKEWTEYAEANPDQKEEAERNIAAINQSCLDYRKERAQSRVDSYPNDMQLRYELAVILWERGEIDPAIEQFQLAQRNPNRRLEALTWLGRCFHAKKQYDIASEQLEKALSSMPVMDKQKKESLYYLGIVYDDMQEDEKAKDCFKQIYMADSRYRDVAQRYGDYSS